ncbi:hypothetical protein PR048_026976 [Dryococelus australis]|uniref:Plastocyanin-like domain-containing protein n=1 Tax=Dryococelus australis TaxID=614101 RepID=A0ABQ9GMR8_9NEOP|nr:hypothetical protein PR048_026976 [Dryococelus australis]
MLSRGRNRLTSKEQKDKAFTLLSFQTTLRHSNGRLNSAPTFCADDERTPATRGGRSQRSVPPAAGMGTTAAIMLLVDPGDACTNSSFASAVKGLILLSCRATEIRASVACVVCRQVCVGDVVVADVWNRVPGQQLSVHWPGLRQSGTPHMDGVPMVTQCPVPANSRYRYVTRAADPGTHLYRAHSGELHPATPPCTSLLQQDNLHPAINSGMDPRVQGPRSEGAIRATVTRTPGALIAPTRKARGVSVPNAHEDNDLSHFNMSVMFPLPTFRLPRIITSKFHETCVTDVPPENAAANTVFEWCVRSAVAVSHQAAGVLGAVIVRQPPGEDMHESFHDHDLEEHTLLLSTAAGATGPTSILVSGKVRALAAPRRNSVFEVSMKQRRNERVGEMGDPREDPPTNGIVRHGSQMQKSGVTWPGFCTWIASVRGEQANISETCLLADDEGQWRQRSKVAGAGGTQVQTAIDCGGGHRLPHAAEDRPASSASRRQGWQPDISIAPEATPPFPRLAYHKIEHNAYANVTLEGVVGEEICGINSQYQLMRASRLLDVVLEIPPEIMNNSELRCETPMAQNFPNFSTDKKCITGSSEDTYAKGTTLLLKANQPAATYKMRVKGYNHCSNVYGEAEVVYRAGGSSNDMYEDKLQTTDDEVRHTLIKGHIYLKTFLRA